MNAMTIQIPLDRLAISPHNARKTGGQRVNDLAASILAHGLLQNLTVEAVDADRFEVVAGGRRLRALQQLQQAGTLPDALATIPCRLIENGEIAEASTAENVIREAMHPADQFDAFKRMVDEGKPITDIAAHFGVAEIVVRQRLRLANLSPKLLALFREDKATLAQMIALSISDDHAHQEKVWAAARGEWQQRPNELRAAIVGKKLSTDKGVAAFVDIKDYEAAGGAVTRDLFGEETYLADPALVEKLALQKLQARADLLKADGWSWTEARINFPWQDRDKFREVDYEWKGGKKIFSTAAKASAGAVVSIDAAGKIEIWLGLLKPGAKQPAPAKSGKKSPNGKAVAAQSAGLSLAQQQMLCGYRTAVARLELASQPKLMLAVLAANLVRYIDNAPSSPETVMLDRNHRVDGMQEFREGLDKAAATKAFATADRDLVAQLRKEVGKGRLLPWLLKQTDETVHKILAAVAARFVNLSNGEGDSLCGDVGIEFGSRWQPSETWFAALQKNTILSIVREVHGKAHDAALAPLKRDDVAKRAAELLAGTGWLPEQLRGPGYALKKSSAPPAEQKKATTKSPAKKAAKPKPKKAAKKAPAKKKPAKKSAPKIPAKS